MSQVPKITKPKIFVIYYSLYGHVRQMAEEIAKGVTETGAVVEIYQVPETLSPDVVKKMGGVDQQQFKDKHPIITDVSILKEADGFIFGIPTRFGVMCAQWKALWDSTGQLWQKGDLVGKPAGIFFSTSTLGGGQETTALTALTQLTHHGMMYIPIGYSAPELMNLNEIHGGSPYGSGTITGPDGSRMPSELERKVCRHQGKHTATIITQLKNGREMTKH